MFFLINFLRNECYCGNAYGSYGPAVSRGVSCNMSCTVNKLEICGGSNANSIYTRNSCPSMILPLFLWLKRHKEIKTIIQFKIEMFSAVAQGLADYVGEPTPEKILPSMFDHGVVDLVSNIIKSFK